MWPRNALFYMDTGNYLKMSISGSAECIEIQSRALQALAEKIMHISFTKNKQWFRDTATGGCPIKEVLL